MNEALLNNVKTAYARFAGKHYLLNREGHFIVASADSAAKLMNKQDITCTPTGVLMAPKGDMAFVYGRLRRGENEANYVRIWRQEQEGWKMAVEVFQ